MTLAEFEAKHKVNHRTMKSWLEKNWIRGARKDDNGQWYIPEGAICPYSKRSTRCKNGIGMYASIIKGCSQGLDVFPLLYNMHPDRFNFFITQLCKSGYIEELEIDGILYYMPCQKCLDCMNMNDSQIKKHIKSSLEVFSPLVAAGAQGITTAHLAKLG